MNKKIPLGTAIGIIIIIVAVTFTATMGVSWKLYNKTLSESTSLESAISKLGETDQLVRKYALGEIDETELNDAIIAGYLSGINDKYASYTPSSLSEASNESRNGISTGIGISYISDTDNNRSYITFVHKGSPAETAGLEKGDMIIASDAGKADDIGIQAVMKSLSGDEGETKSLTVIRNSSELNIVCKIAKYESITVTGTMYDTVGIIKISSFNALSADQFKEVYTKLLTDGAKSLVIDIRHNGGGIMSAAKNILDIILPEGTLYTAEFSDGTTEKYTSDSSFISLPMALLIDNETASAAEMFASAFKDYMAGPIIGETTYGKGVMQRTYTLSDESQITITVAKFYSPDGYNYDGKGIEPNFTVSLSKDAKKNFYLLTYEDDIQLQTAVSMVSHF